MVHTKSRKLSLEQKKKKRRWYHLGTIHTTFQNSWFGHAIILELLCWYVASDRSRMQQWMHFKWNFYPLGWQYALSIHFLVLWTCLHVAHSVIGITNLLSFSMSANLHFLITTVTRRDIDLLHTAGQGPITLLKLMDRCQVRFFCHSLDGQLCLCLPGDAS